MSYVLILIVLTGWGSTPITIEMPSEAACVRVAGELRKDRQFVAAICINRGGA